MNGRPAKVGVQQDTCGIDYVTQQTGVKFGGEPVGQPEAERGLRADHGQVDPLARDEPNDGIGVEDVEGFGGNRRHRHSGVAGSAE